MMATIGSLMASAPQAEAGFYRTAAGAEIDLVLDLGGRDGRWCVEIKRGLTPKTSKSLLNAKSDLVPDRTFIVYSGEETYPVAEGIEAIGVLALAEKLKETRK